MRREKTTSKLDRIERQIEDQAAEFHPVSAEKMKRVEGILDSARKTRNINIRISETDLNQLKSRSQEEGLPYQTLIASILHKYVSNRLVDEESIRKSLHLLRSKD